MQRIGRFTVTGQVGRGGMGVVLKATDPEGRTVAIKLITRTQPEAHERFEREARLLSSFSEAEGVVPLLEVGASEGHPFLVMPFIEGGTLRDRLVRGKLGVEETVTLGRALAQALAHAHAKGIVHRDVKPENILFTKDGRPLLADLGLAKHFDVDSPGGSQSVALSRTGEFRGTAGYMAPEQAHDAAVAGPRADVFSLGAVLHECIAGTPAFTGDSPISVLGAVVRGEHEALPPDAPRALAAVVGRCLERDPKKRFRDGHELAHALATLDAPSRRPIAVLALVTVLLVVSVVTVAAAKPGKSPAPDPAPVAPATSDKIEARVVPELGPCQKIVPLADGKRAVAASGDGRRTLLVDLVAGRTLHETPGQDFAVSPDEKTLYVVEKSALEEVSVESWAVTHPFAGEAHAREVAVSPEGAFLLYTLEDGWETIDLRTGKVIVARHAGSPQLEQPVILPGSDRVFGVIFSRGVRAPGVAVIKNTEKLLLPDRSSTGGGRLFASNRDGSAITIREPARLIIINAEGTERGALPLGSRIPGVFAVSPDGSRVLISWPGGEITRWDVGAARDVPSFRVPRSATALAFLPDGKRALAVDTAGTLYLFRVS